MKLNYIYLNKWRVLNKKQTGESVCFGKSLIMKFKPLIDPTTKNDISQDFVIWLKTLHQKYKVISYLKS